MAESRMVYRPYCGCEVYRIMQSKPNLYRIQYCPLHEAALAMYEALKDLMEALEINGSNDVRVAYNLAKQAIAESEGKVK